MADTPIPITDLTAITPDQLPRLASAALIGEGWLWFVHNPADGTTYGATTTQVRTAVAVPPPLFSQQAPPNPSQAREGALYYQVQGNKLTIYQSESGIYQPKYTFDPATTAQYVSSTQTYTATCPTGTVGNAVTKTATRIGLTQAEADAAALSAAKVAAESLLVCAVVASQPAAPTFVSQDDTANTFTFAAPAGYTFADCDYYIVTNGVAGDEAPCPSTTITVGNVAVGAGSLRVYVRPASGRAKGLELTNTSPFTIASQATVPQQVSGLTATPGNAQVVLNWSAPGNGGSAITGYKVYQGSTLLTTVTGTTYTVPGLTNGSPYSFTVAAVNSVGTGQPSASAEATPTAPSLPSYDTTLSSSTSEGGGVSFAPASTEQLKFNAIAGAVGLPQDMVVVLGSTTSYVTFPAEYAGQGCALIDADGVRHDFLFTNGTVTL